MNDVSLVGRLTKDKYDFNLIDRLDKTVVAKFTDIIENENLIYGRGYKIGTLELKPVPEKFKSLKILDSKKSSFSCMYYNKKTLVEHNIEKMSRSRNTKLYDPPFLLIKKGTRISNDSIVKSFVSEDQMLFSTNFTSIKGNKDSIKLLKCISAILSSDLAKYYIFMISSSLAVERDQIHQYEILEMPIKIDDSLSDIYDEINDLKFKIDENSEMVNNKLEYELEESYNKLNKKVNQIYNLSEFDISLIEYSNEISIPLYNHQKSCLKNIVPLSEVLTNDLNNYCEIIKNYFNDIMEGLILENDVTKANGLLGITFHFCTTDQISTIKEDIFNSLKVLDINKLLMSFTNDAFIKRKVIYGFFEDGFYLIKPDERKYWHKANAYKDFYEIKYKMFNGYLDNNDIDRSDKNE